MGVPDPAAMLRVAVTQVDVPEWGGEVYVRPLRARDVVGLDQMDSVEAVIEMVRRGACREDGALLFDQDDAAEFIGGLDWTVVQRIGEAVMDVNGMTGLDEKKAPTETSATS